ncbi:RIP metalloprotease RseP [Ovoidimarina sediminis]|uniref:RIP metalloprotease RseP n=1 Tax=Ovoidimarina sediminis TaxID=3079856 RepID=UPI00291219D4|nr:RIP metalloprotease RseP [Rhodophyticola sp. MJ-SS7]MDU8941907.1 RIP metalloprotease RseP [Rhodophyticola sp. MJ-SS7]
MDMVGLIPSFGNFLTTAVAFIVALSIIVAIHEYGHYIVGRWTGIGADVFSIGFGPVLFRRTDKRGTQWQVAAIPLGGYVKFKGDANAASAPDAGAVEGLSAEERRATMHGAPLWARALTVSAGPVFNFILSIIVFMGLIFYNGAPRDPLTVHLIAPMPFQPMELLEGDELVSIAGIPTPPIDELGDYFDTLPQEPFLAYEVRRDGAVIEVMAPHPLPTVVSGLNPQSAALAVDLQEGDVITAVDGAPVIRFEELRDHVGTSDGRVLMLSVWRDGEELEFAVRPKREDLPLDEGGFETRWLLGIHGSMFFEPATEAAGPIDAFGRAVDQTVGVATSSLSVLYNVVAGQIQACNVRGPVTIARVSGDTISMGWENFIGFIAVLSTAVGLLNLLPIPVLDGGHLVFHAYEAVRGRPPNDRALRVLMGAGLAILLSFMLFALTNDFFCP